MSEPKERPILFSAPMVRAILEARKTQTRRIVKPQPPADVTVRQYTNLATGRAAWGYETGPSESRGDVKYTDGSVHPLNIGLCKTFRCPYGEPGDRLWVREAWRVASFMPGERVTFQYADGTSDEESGTGDEPQYEDWRMRIDEQSSEDCRKAGLTADEEGLYHWEPGQPPTRWRSSIHMPRWASRITLEICGIRVHRLHEISPTDAIAEGIEPVHAGWKDYSGVGGFWDDPVHSFRGLWESIHGAGFWEANPWVWAIEFRRLP